LALSAVVLAGCDGEAGLTLGETKLEPMPSPVAVMVPGAKLPLVDAPQNKVKVGDQFTYDNPPQIWTVVDDTGDRVVWQNQSGGRMTSHYNTVLPALGWDMTGLKGRRELINVSGGLFPLKKGNSVTFDVEGQSDRPASRWRARWRCSVEESKTIQVKAGTSDTWPIRCHRNNNEMLLFHFSPQIGHYVRYESEQQGYASVRQLTAYARNARLPEPPAPPAPTRAKKK